MEVLAPKAYVSHRPLLLEGFSDDNANTSERIFILCYEYALYDQHFRILGPIQFSYE